MRYRLFPLVLVALLLTLTLGCRRHCHGPMCPVPPLPAPVQPQPHVHTLTVYSEPGCPYCVKLHEAMKDPAVVAELKRFSVTEVNDPKQGQAHGVHGFPTSVVTDAGGKEEGRKEGYLPPGELVSWLKTYP